MKKSEQGPAGGGYIFALFAMCAMIAGATYRRGDAFWWVILRSVLLAVPAFLGGLLIAKLFEEMKGWIKSRYLRYGICAVIVIVCIWIGYGLNRW